MDKRLKASIAAAVLLAGAGAFYRFGFVLPGIEQAAQGKADAFGPADELQIAQPRNALEHCREAAWLIYDVHWAVACMKEADRASSSPAAGHADCDLPDAKAAVVNAWLNEAESRCISEARAGGGR